MTVPYISILRYRPSIIDFPWTVITWTIRFKISMVSVLNNTFIISRISSYLLRQCLRQEAINLNI